MTTSMESYIVRIYRRDKNNPNGLVGIVEETSLGGKKPFHCLEELGRILRRDAPPKPAAEKGAEKRYTK